jgi:hypothetical protein
VTSSPVHCPGFGRRESRLTTHYVPVLFQNDAPDNAYIANGTHYERLVKYPSNGSQHTLSKPLIYDSSDSLAPGKGRFTEMIDDRYLHNAGQGLGTQGESILPSIEGPQLASTSFQRRTVSTNRPSVLSTGGIQSMKSANDAGRRVEDIEYLDLTGEIQPLKKRPRMEPTDTAIARVRVSQDAIARKYEPEYVPLHASADRLPDPRGSQPMPSSQYVRYQDYAKMPSFVPTHVESKAFTSPSDLIRTGERQVARPPAERQAGMSHFRSHDVLYPSTPSPRTDEEFVVPSRRLASALPGSASSAVDPGIQEYRAFRARERQSGAPWSPGGKGKVPLRGDGDVVYPMTESPGGWLRQVDGARSPGGLRRRWPSSARIQEYVTVDDTLPLPLEEVSSSRRGRISERIPRPRRRSASPLQNPTGRLSYVTASTHGSLDDFRERRSDYLPTGWERAVSHNERIAPVLVRPSRR